MINKILEQSIRNRWLIIVAFIALAFTGSYFLTQLSIDAVPDITPVQVVVNTHTAALDPEQIEKTVSSLIEAELGGIAQSKEIRSLSKYGLSQVVVIFADGTDIYWARQQVSERLQNIREQLPEGLSPELAPITTGLGEVLMYAIQAKADSSLAKKSEQERLIYLRTIQDFVIRAYLKSNVAGIAEVDSTGGYKKEIHIDVNPHKLEAKGLVINNVIEKLETLGESFGGGYIQSYGEQVIVKTQGAISNLDEIRNMSIALNVYGKAIRVKDVADVREDFTQRLGAATYNGNEAVLGMVLMLSGANSRQVAIDAERALANVTLPPDVETKILYSRRVLVEATMKTVAKNLAEGAALVVIVLLLLLGNLRAALLVSLAIPLSMLCAVLGMKYFNISANLMSLGAIDFGLLVDASIVIIENVMRRLAFYPRVGGNDRVTIVLDSVKEVAGTVVVGLLLIMAVYVPVLALEGIEGKLFRPMVQTVLLALGASLLVALLLMPVLAYLLLQNIKHRETLFFSLMKRVYKPLLLFSLHYRFITLIPIIALSIYAGWTFLGLGADFMPPLNEGDMVINLTRANNIALDKSIEMQKHSEKVIAGFADVQHVFARMGTPESATDPMGVHLADTFVILKEEAKQRSKDALFNEMREAIDQQVPGQEIMQAQPIEMRFNEILEGSRADVSVKIYGPDLDKLLELLENAKEKIEKIPGASEVELDALTALRKSPVLNIHMNHEKIARYGVDISEVNRVLASAMAGCPVGSYYEANWRFPIVIRLTEECRENPDELKDLKIALPDKGAVALEKLARIDRNEQVTTIAHDQGQRYAAVAVNLAGRDIESFVKEAKQTLQRELELPQGYTLSWGGQFKNLERARAKLMILVPIILLGIFLVMLKHFGSFRQACLVYLSIPFAMTGGIVSLALRDLPLSVSAAIGFIALTGIAILNALVLVSYFNQLRNSGASLQESVVDGAMTRLKPVMMTALVASFGFIPMAINTGLGAEVQRPLATVVIGGLITSTMLTLLVIPMLYLWVERKDV